MAKARWYISPRVYDSEQDSFTSKAAVIGLGYKCAMSQVYTNGINWMMTKIIGVDAVHTALSTDAEIIVFGGTSYGDNAKTALSKKTKDYLTAKGILIKDSDDVGNIIDSVIKKHSLVKAKEHNIIYK